MKKRCTALLLFVILILGTVVPASAEAAQEYPGAESESINSEQEYPGAESETINSEQEYPGAESETIATEQESSDREYTEEEASPEDLELLEFDKALEWVNDQLLYFDIVSEGADSLEMYYYMAEGSDFLYAQPIIGGVMAALQQEPKPLITVNVTDEQGTLLSTISGIRYGTRFSAAVPEAPVKPEDASNTYSFTGWDETTVPFILTADTEVCACYRATAKEPKDISAAVISDIDPVSYTGSPITPEFTVTEAGENGRVLMKGKDYTLSYADNTDAGTASVTVSGIGDYSGNRTKSFEILPRQVTPVITLEKDAYVYDGARKRPAVNVTVNPPALINGSSLSQTPGSTLSEDTSILLKEVEDYDVFYPEGCVQAGTYTVMVTLKGNYAGAGEAQFSISPRDMTPQITLAADSYTYNGKARKPGVIVIFDGKELIENTDYTVKYQNNINAGTAVVVITGKGDFTGTVRKSVKPHTT